MNTLDESLGSLIDLVLAEKKGNTEFVLMFDGMDAHDPMTAWTAAIGNQCRHVNIGESLGYGLVDFVTEAQMPEMAVSALLEAVKAGQNEQV